MKKGYGVGDKHSQDPIGSDESRGKDRSQRKARGDGPSWTPTESKRRADLLRQFITDGPKGASYEYVNSDVWCFDCNGRRMKAEGLERCERCQEAANHIQ